jgi:predicted transposase/invertase (TIGR01784 family)
MGVFIDPATDWGFKRIFGDKELLINFLNSLLEGERVITSLKYMNNERVPRLKDERKVIYDLYCETDTGEHIIVEMQKRWQEHFKDRALYYSACSIYEQGDRGEWDYKLTPVYGVFFLDFLLDTDDSDYFCRDVSLVDKYTGKVFSNKLRHIYIELPRFMKSQADCDSFFDYWIYNLANMKQMKEISFKDRDAIFGRLEELASRGNMSKEERAQYDYEWKIYNDYLNTFNSAEKKGHAEGLAEGRAEGRSSEKK